MNFLLHSQAVGSTNLSQSYEVINQLRNYIHFFHSDIHVGSKTKGIKNRKGKARDENEICISTDGREREQRTETETQMEKGPGTDKELHS